MSSVFIYIQSVGQPYNNSYHTSLCHNISCGLTNLCGVYYFMLFMIQTSVKKSIKAKASASNIYSN